MKLEDYLKAIKECPDEKLTKEFGIYDNFPIFVNADFHGIVKHFSEFGNYHIAGSGEVQSYLLTEVHYNPGTVIMTIYNRETDMAKTRHHNVLSGVYAVQLTLHPYQKKKIENVPWLRAIAMAVDDIGQFLIKENIPACMLNTTGWDYLNTDNGSRLVVHEPIGPIVSEYLRVKNEK
jgi:hypothetical protein